MRLLSLFALIGAASAQLFGLSAGVGLIRVYDNGTTLSIGPALPAELEAQNLATLDSAGGVYYFVGYNQAKGQPQLVGLSLATGAVTSAVPLPFAEESFVGVGQYMAFASDSKLVVLSGQTAHQPHLVITGAPATGASRRVCAIAHEELDVLGGSAAYVPGAELFVFNLGVNDTIANFVVDLKSGAVVNSTNTARGNLESMVFNPTDQLIYGLGLDIEGQAWNRSIASFDPVALTYSQRGVVPGYGIESGGISAINVAAGSIYWIGMQAPYVAGSPLFLIQNRLADAAIVSVSAELCAADAACPWSLEFRQ